MAPITSMDSKVSREVSWLWTQFWHMLWGYFNSQMDVVYMQYVIFVYVEKILQQIWINLWLPHGPCQILLWNVCCPSVLRQRVMPAGARFEANLFPGQSVCSENFERGESSRLANINWRTVPSITLAFLMLWQGWAQLDKPIDLNFRINRYWFLVCVCRI